MAITYDPSQQDYSSDPLDMLAYGLGRWVDAEFVLPFALQSQQPVMLDQYGRVIQRGQPMPPAPAASSMTPLLLIGAAVVVAVLVLK